MQYHRRIERSFAAGERPVLAISNRRGELVVIGEDRDDIAFTAQLTVHADSEREGEARLDSIHLPISDSGGRLVIGPPEFEESDGGVTIFGFRVGILPALGAHVDMQVRVPRRCEVDAEQRAGPIRVTGVRDGLRVRNRAGRCEVRDIEGKVHIDGRSGPVEVHGVRGPLAVYVRSGKVEVEDVEGDVEIDSRSGTITARNVRGRLSARGRAGRMRFEEVAGTLDCSTTAGSVEFRGRVTHPISAEVHSGSIRLAVTRDSSFFLDAESHVGSIRSDLPVDYLDKPPREAPVVRLRTHSGSIRIVPA